MVIGEVFNGKRPSITVAFRLPIKALFITSPVHMSRLQKKGPKRARCGNERYGALRELFFSVLGLSAAESENAACLTHMPPPASKLLRADAGSKSLDIQAMLAQTLFTAAWATDRTRVYIHSGGCCFIFVGLVALRKLLTPGAFLPWAEYSWYNEM
jgi:hypothetical protein